MKELREKLKRLQKLKRKTRAKTEERREINREIRELRGEIEQKRKQRLNHPLVKAIYELQPHLKKMVDLTEHTGEELERHLARILEPDYIPLLERWAIDREKAEKIREERE